MGMVDMMEMKMEVKEMGHRDSDGNRGGARDREGKRTRDRDRDEVKKMERGVEEERKREKNLFLCNFSLTHIVLPNNKIISCVHSL